MNDKLFVSNPERRLRSVLDELFNKDINTNDRKNKVVFHSLRHTFASHLAINGTPIFTIQKLRDRYKFCVKSPKVTNTHLLQL